LLRDTSLGCRWLARVVMTVLADKGPCNAQWLYD
jgi:hypothetical protein